MTLPNLRGVYLSDRDLDFLIETTSTEVADKRRLKEIIREDEDFRNSFTGDRRVFRRVMDDDEIFLKISPALFFEILLRKAADELGNTGYTIEKEGNMKIPVFDATGVAEVLANRSLLLYLADMLSSFTRVESYALSFRVRKGVWKKIKFNDLDIHSLMAFADAVEERQRLSFYKRIADICLFVLGIFPHYAERNYRYPFSREVRPRIGAKQRIAPEDYDKEGRRFYRLAAEHQTAKDLALSDVFWALHQNLQKAKKPLNFIAEHYLSYKQHLAAFGF